MKKKSKPELKPKLKLWVVLLGGRPADARIEQHNVFWGAAYELEDLYGAIKRSWLSVRQVHIDAFMCVEQIYDYDVLICEKSAVENLTVETNKKLYLVNAGFYNEDVMSEYHGAELIVASDKIEVINLVKSNSDLSDVASTCFHIDDCHLLSTNIDVETPDNIELNQGEFIVCLKKVRSGSDAYPKVVVGYYKIP